ncbi:MAG: CMD domain protein, partial [Candidatus Rokuibacteriota bacterium]
MLRESGVSRDADLIDALVGITPGSFLDAIRARRPEARAHAQATYRALFSPETPGSVTAQERFAAGTFVAGLHGATAIAVCYAARLAESGGPAALREAVDAAIKEAKTHGPYGSYPAGPLSREDIAGPVYRVDAVTRRTLGPRLAAAFEHAHMLVFHPRDAWAGRPLSRGKDQLYPVNPSLVERVWQATFTVDGARRAGAAGDGLMLSRTQPRPANAPDLSLTEIQNPMIDAYMGALPEGREPRI